MQCLTYSQRTNWACSYEAHFTIAFVSGQQRYKAAVPTLAEHCSAVFDASQEWILSGFPPEVHLPPMTADLSKTITLCESILHRIIVDGVHWTMDSFTDTAGRAAIPWAYGTLLALGYSPWSKYARVIVQQVGVNATHLVNALVMAGSVLAQSDLNLVVSQCCPPPAAGAANATNEAVQTLILLAAGVGDVDSTDFSTARWLALLQPLGSQVMYLTNGNLKAITALLVLRGNADLLSSWTKAQLAACAAAQYNLIVASEATAAAAAERAVQPCLELHPLFNAYTGMVLAQVLVMAALYGRQQGAVSMKATVQALKHVGLFDHPEEVVSAEYLPGVYKHFGLTAPEDHSGAERVLMQHFHAQTVTYFTHALGPHSSGCPPQESTFHPDDVMMLLLPSNRGGLLSDGVLWPSTHVYGMMTALASAGCIHQLLDVFKGCGLYFVDDPAVVRVPNANDDNEVCNVHDDDDGGVVLADKAAPCSASSGWPKSSASATAAGDAAATPPPASIFSDAANPRVRSVDAPEAYIKLQSHQGVYHHTLGSQHCLRSLWKAAAQAGHMQVLKTAAAQRMHPVAAELAASDCVLSYPYTSFMQGSVAGFAQLLDSNPEGLQSMLGQYGTLQHLLSSAVTCRRVDLFMVMMHNSVIRNFDGLRIGNGGWTEAQQFVAYVRAAAAASLAIGFVAGAAATLPFAWDVARQLTPAAQWEQTCEVRSYGFSNVAEVVARSNTSAPGCLHVALHHPEIGNVGRGAGVTATQFYLNLGVVYAMNHPSKGNASYDCPVGGYTIRDAALVEFLEELHAAGGGIQPPLGPHPDAPRASYDALLASAEKLRGSAGTRRRAILLKHVSKLESESLQDFRKWHLEMNVALGTLNWPAVLDLFQTVPVCKQWSLGRAHFVASCVELASGNKACPTSTAKLLLQHATKTLGFTPEQLELTPAQLNMLSL